MGHLQIVVCLFLLGGILQASAQEHPHVVQHTIHHPRGVSYPGLGFFSLAPPFNNTDWLPSRPDFINTRFTLYTRGHSWGNGEPLSGESRSSILSSHLNASQPVKILVHGFLQHGSSEFLKNMTKALLDYAPMNVIVVGWGGGAGFPYSQAVANTRVVGAEVARLVKLMVKVTGSLTAGDFHIIGHSLGAQIAGYAGSHVPGLARITGLDPAQPSYEGFDPLVRLDQSDARFVDVIHTDARPYDTVGGYGYIGRVGHIDFYPNGGHHQPGCHEDSSIMDFLSDAWRRGIGSAEVGLSCSHERSTQLFTDSIVSRSSPCSFYAFPCDSESHFMRGECLDCGNRPCPVMGYHADRSFGVRGKFYINTTDHEPFCGNHFFVTLRLATSMDDADGTLSIQLTGERGQSKVTTIRRGAFTMGGVYTGLVLGEDIGHVTQVHVHYDQAASYGSWVWGRQQVHLQAAEVTHVMRVPTKYFCQTGQMVIPSGQVLSMGPGSFEASSCP